MSSIIENNTVYRFRSMNSLLGDAYQELERQSIFFAPPEILNDPAEGFRDIYFKGDDILWKNLFTHYLASLFNITFDYYIFGEDTPLVNYIQTFSPESTIPEEIKPSWEEIKKSFFSEESVAALISNIVEYRTEVSQPELSFYLGSLHPLALTCIFNQLEKTDTPNSPKDIKTIMKRTKKPDGKFFESLKKMEEKDKENKIYVLMLQYQLQSQFIPLTIEYNREKQEPNKRLLVCDFPFTYTKKLEQLMYPNWLTACFMSSPTNSSIWGNYGNNHSGACLIFNTDFDNNSHSLTLDNDIIGYGSDGQIKGRSIFSFHQIRYTHKQDALNFFESIGQLPIPEVNKQWLTDNGIRSKYFSNFNDEWRKKHWENFYVPITQKSKEWAYENEHRLIINNMGGQHDRSGVTLNYEFKSLKGIIFGINTSPENKLKIFKIIEKKVRENDCYDFKFHQAYYCRYTGEIKNAEISTLRFSK
ncbi:DUF2971 domain-containing protein [Kosakonia sp. ML.JS2a]|uniref:DUF2971 domain-containing protein n=1 Tax=Kosakonia sp. ML.JS2a TaxID=2980557 RepID=UPI0021D8038E|nr:DUF2971 domain-containing protein [Kosakonia sp. ML.JS2a]UXY10062.1 DUF2971 domain-containing protein [Kosakonia sp. ML.JS2a]